MTDILLHHWKMLLGRWYGPLSFRFVVQPLAAAILGLRAGLADARGGRSPYGWDIVVRTGCRRALIRNGWRDISKVFFAALTMDLIYVAVEYHWFHPGQSLLVATTVAIPVYVVTRGLTNRLVRRATSAGGTRHGHRAKSGGPDTA
jgi:hypothetical protein